MPNVLDISWPVSVTGGSPIGTAQVNHSVSSEVIPLGQSVTLTYALSGATDAWLQLPNGAKAPLDLNGGTYVYTPQVSGPYPIVAVDANGGRVVDPVSVIVQEDLPALDPNAPAGFTTVKDGPWDDPATWAGSVPTRDMTAWVRHAVTVSGRACQSGRTIVDGSLAIANGVLYTSDVYVRLGGLLSLDGTNGKALVMSRNRPRHANDANDLWRAVIIEGALTMTGLPTTPTARLAKAPKAGDVSLTVAAPVTGWNIGNKLLLPDSRQLKQSEVRAAGAFVDHSEVVVVRGVSADGLTIYLLRPTRFDHPCAVDTDGITPARQPHVVNLIRTAGLVTSDPTTVATRAHIQFRGRATIDCVNAVFHGFGRTTLAGGTADRLSVLCKDLIGPQGGLPSDPTCQGRITGCSILDPTPIVAMPQALWGLRLSNSHYLRVENNVSYNWQGAGIMLDGDTSSNRVTGNFVNRIFGTGHRSDDNEGRGKQGHGIWMGGPLNFVDNNVCTGVNFGGVMGHCYTLYFSPNNPQSVKVPLSQGDDPAVKFKVADLVATPLASFSNPEAYGATSNGLEYWGLNATDGGPWTNTVGSVIKGLTVWGIHEYALGTVYQSQFLTVDGFRHYGDPHGDDVASFEPMDYATIDFTMVNFKLVNIRKGWSASSSAWGKTQTIKNGYVKAKLGAVIGTMWTSGNQADGLKPRKVVIENVVFEPFGANSNAVMLGFNSAPVRNLIQRDEVFLINCTIGGQLVSGQVFYNEQGATFIVPISVLSPGSTTGHYVLGSPEAGLTNAQNWAKYNIAIAGAVAPADAVTKPGIVGLVK